MSMCTCIICTYIYIYIYVKNPVKRSQLYTRLQVYQQISAVLRHLFISSLRAFWQFLHLGCATRGRIENFGTIQQPPVGSMLKHQRWFTSGGVHSVAFMVKNGEPVRVWGMIEACWPQKRGILSMELGCFALKAPVIADWTAKISGFPKAGWLTTAMAPNISSSNERLLRNHKKSLQMEVFVGKTSIEWRICIDFHGFFPLSCSIPRAWTMPVCL